MAVINNSSISDILQEMNAQYSVAYSDAFNSAKTYMDPLIQKVSSKSNTFRRVWLTTAPSMRAALGQRHIKNLELEAFSTATADYESTVGIPRADVLSDQWGLYTPVIANLGNAAKRHVDDLVKARLQAGTTDTGFDGAAFFAATHDLDPGGNQSNLLTSTGLSDANFAVAVATMRSYTDNQGNPLGVEPTHLVVPPALEKTARDIILADLVANGGTNTQKGLVELIVNPYLSNEPTVWYLAGNLGSIRPFTHVEFIAPTLVSMTDPKDDNVFHNFQYVYGVDSNDAVTLDAWFTLIRCVA